MLHQDLIQKIIISTKIQAGENVLVQFWGENEEKETIDSILKSLTSLGASPFVLYQSRSTNQNIFETATKLCFGDSYFRLLQTFDTVIDVFAYPPLVLSKPLEEQQMNIYRNYIRRLFQAISGAKKFIQFRLPTAENAADSGLTAEAYIEKMTAAYDIDYNKLNESCHALLNSLDGAATVLVESGNGCVAQFSVLGRTWYVDSGDGDLPCGEVYIAPLEGTASGKLFFETFYFETDALEKETNATLYLSEGKITHSDKESINQFLRSLDDTSISELGIGQNPNVTSLCGCFLLDEKMLGSFHIGLGANVMFGGTIDSGHHIDFTGIGTIKALQNK